MGYAGVAGDYGAQERTRTSTTVKSLVPETSASTNSATWAGVDCQRDSVRVNALSLRQGEMRLVWQGREG
jgi:hypothetical protein